MAGQLPDFWDKLSALTFLALGFNRLEGKLPNELGQMKDIQFIELSYNSLSSTILESFTALKHLSYLDLSYNALYGPLPVSLQNMTSLSTLLLQGNLLTGALDPSLNILREARSLNLTLGHNFFTSFSSTPGSLPCYPKLYFNCFNNSNSLYSDPCNILGLQRANCEVFCGTTFSQEPCGGKGYCYATQTGALGCDCFEGFHASTETLTCIPGSPGEQSLANGCMDRRLQDVIPINVGTAFGVDTDDGTDQQALNRWSRYLSRGWSKKTKTWDIRNFEAWVAPSLLFPQNLQVQPAYDWFLVQSQGTCSSCWAFGAKDSVASALALTVAPPALEVPAIRDLSLEQILTCRDGYTELTRCNSGSPANALEDIVAKGLTFNGSFTGTCPAARIPLKGSFPRVRVLMYENVKFQGWLGLLLTVAAQPVIVSLEGSYQGFATYTSRAPDVFSDQRCYSGSIDHSVLLVGYQLDYALGPYWVIRNSWGAGWGYRGYARIAMIPAASITTGNPDPFGICGIPAPLPNDPCYTKGTAGEKGRPLLNPCGGGQCINMAQKWGPYSYRCDCSNVQITRTDKNKKTTITDGFVAMDNTVGLTISLGPAGSTSKTQSCVPVDACGSKNINPCGVGVCRNTEPGDYTCVCPFGYVLEVNSNGSPICAPASSSAVIRQYTVPTGTGGISYYLIAIVFGLDMSEIAKNNGLQEGNELRRSLDAGTIVNVTNVRLESKGDFWCTATYTVSAGDTTCTIIEEKLGLMSGDLKEQNPALECTTSTSTILDLGMQLCLRRGAFQRMLQCQAYAPISNTLATCEAIIEKFFTGGGGTGQNNDDKSKNGLLQFYALNPGIRCDKLRPSAVAGRLTGQANYQYVCVQADTGVFQCGPNDKTTPLSANDKTGCMKLLNNKKLATVFTCSTPPISADALNNFLWMYYGVSCGTLPATLGYLCLPKKRTENVCAAMQSLPACQATYRSLIGKPQGCPAANKLPPAKFPLSKQK